MRRIIITCFSLGLLLLACNSTDTKYSSLISIKKLPSQKFIINSSRDTTLVTAKGAILTVSKGTLAAEIEIVELEIKEAYSMEDIFRAGLTTQTNGQPLSSGGMIYINAVKANTVIFKKKISIAIPGEKLDAKMKLYKGEQLNDDKINWTNPVDLPENPQLKELEKGKQLFIANCASCHAIGHDLTGPNLAHMVKRSKIIAKKEGHNYLYEFTRNWNKVYSKSKHYRAISCWSPSAMSWFEPISDKELDNLYSYIENESELNNLPIPANSLDECIDSCRSYERSKDSLQGIRTQLEKDSVPMVIEKRDTFLTSPVTPPIINELELVNPLAFKSLYYQFTVESFGWYNVDILLKDESLCVPSNLTVSMKGQYSERVNLYLIIPSLKALLPGGLLTNQKTTYGFYEKDGSIPLPADAKAYIIAIGEYEDRIIFSEQQFITSRKQSIEIELSFIGKEEFNKKMNSLSFNELNLSVADTKKADSLRKVIKDLKEVETLKPKGCDCNCGKLGETLPAANNINDEQPILNPK